MAAGFHLLARMFGDVTYVTRAEYSDRAAMFDTHVARITASLPPHAKVGQGSAPTPPARSTGSCHSGALPRPWRAAWSHSSPPNRLELARSVSDIERTAGLFDILYLFLMVLLQEILGHKSDLADGLRVLPRCSCIHRHSDC